jgi:hypothetical protein
MDGLDEAYHDMLDKGKMKELGSEVKALKKSLAKYEKQLAKLKSKGEKAEETPEEPAPDAAPTDAAATPPPTDTATPPAPDAAAMPADTATPPAPDAAATTPTTPPASTPSPEAGAEQPEGGEEELSPESKEAIAVEKFVKQLKSDGGNIARVKTLAKVFNMVMKEAEPEDQQNFFKLLRQYSIKKLSNINNEMNQQEKQ